jgi:hypothetical protein
MRTRALVFLFVVGCSSSSLAPIGGDAPSEAGAGTDGGVAGGDGGAVSTNEGGGGDDGGTATDATGGDTGTGTGTGTLGVVSNVMEATCTTKMAGAKCKTVTITGCAGLESEAINAMIAIVPPNGAVNGTVIHLIGGGGEGYETAGVDQYSANNLLQVFVDWATDWELTKSVGIKAAACRPATIMKWIFDNVHTGGHTAPFCGQGHSGGSGQLGYALAQYGMGDYFDYVNELSGPPFARIDLGCDGDAPQTASVCGVDDPTHLPPSLMDPWERIAQPLTCGAQGVPAAELERWKNDSITIGGVYNYPNTEVQFFDCTYKATGVTAMAQIYFNTISQAEGPSGQVGFNCVSQADGCSGEGLGPTGNTQLANALVTGCKRRH